MSCHDTLSSNPADRELGMDNRCPVFGVDDVDHPVWRLQERGVRILSSATGQ
jgi:hypothetical protein